MILRNRLIWACLSIVGFSGVFGCGKKTPPMMGNDAGPDDAAMTSGATVHFAPSTTAMSFADVPWPSDLYRTNGNTIELAQMPGEAASPDPAYFAAMRASLADIDGFSDVSSVFFSVDSGDVDPTSLPLSPADSVSSEASAFIVDVDSTSPSAFTKTPADASYRANGHYITLRPANGHPLYEGRLYAAVVTTDVHTLGGASIGASPSFAAVRDAHAAPSDPALAKAYALYSPVLASLASNGVATSKIAGFTVFRVQNVTHDMAQARTQIRATDAPAVTVIAVSKGADLDTRLGTPTSAVRGFTGSSGVLHEHIGYMIHGRLAGKNFDSADATTHGRFQHDSSGALIVKRTDDVPFTLWLPNAGDLSALPVVVYQHGLGSERGSGLGIADACNEAGWALLAIDAPFHGMRAATAHPDTTNGYAGTSTPDDFGDATGPTVILSYGGIGEQNGELVDFHPFYMADTIRQSALDLMSAVHTIDTSSAWDPVRTADSGLASLGFTNKLTFVGISLGGIIGTTFVANEPRVGAALLASTGGSLTKLVAWSGVYNTFLGVLMLRLGIQGAGQATAYTYLDSPQVALWQTLMDRGDSMSFAHTLGASKTPVLMQMAYDDESVPNVATESLARAIGMPMVSTSTHPPRFTDLQTTASPVSDNVVYDTMNSQTTRALFTYDPASHTMLYLRTGESDFNHPVAPPFTHRMTPTTWNNPVDAAQDQMINFFNTWLSTSTAQISGNP